MTYYSSLWYCVNARFGLWREAVVCTGPGSGVRSRKRSEVHRLTCKYYYLAFYSSSFFFYFLLTYFLSFYLPSVCTVNLPYRIQLVSIHYTMLWRMPWRGTAEMSYCNIVHCSILCKSCFAVICHAKVYYRVLCGTTQCSVLTHCVTTETITQTHTHK